MVPVQRIVDASHRLLMMDHGLKQIVRQGRLLTKLLKQRVVKSLTDGSFIEIIAQKGKRLGAPLETK